MTLSAAVSECPCVKLRETMRPERSSREAISHALPDDRRTSPEAAIASFCRDANWVAAKWPSWRRWACEPLHVPLAQTVFTSKPLPRRAPGN
jgi:hypothetical protein